MQLKRSATARWNGSGKEGNGSFNTASNAIKELPYSYKTRFENEPGTNPEELIGAAHAGCFSMKLAFNLQEAGITAESIETKATVILDNGAVTESNLETRVKAPGLDQAKLDELANHAKENCPISMLLNAKMSVKAELAG